MHLSRTAIRAIEEHLDEGTTVEVTLKNGNLTTSPRPADSNDIDFPPTLLSNEEHVFVIIMTRKLGEEPVEIHRVEVAPGIWISGLKGYLKDE